MKLRKKPLITAFLIILLTSIALSMPPPWTYYPEACEDSGGNWPGSIDMDAYVWQELEYSAYSCKCPEETKLLWGKCWKRTPKKTCEELEGNTTRKEGMVGVPGAGFKCVKETEEGIKKDITAKVKDYSTLSNEKLKKLPDKRPNLLSQLPSTPTQPITLTIFIITILSGIIAIRKNNFHTNFYKHK